MSEGLLLPMGSKFALYTMIFCSALLVAASIARAAPTYVWKEKSGAIRFTDKPPPEGVQAKVFSAKHSTFSWYRVEPLRGGGRLYHDRYNPTIELAAQAYGVDISLLKAVIHCESGFNPYAVSPKGAQGLMQLMPDRARRLGVRNSFSPDDNIYGGARHLAELLAKYHGSVKLALAAYNAGSEAVEKYGGVPPYQETQDYVQRVMHMRDRYAVAQHPKSRLKTAEAAGSQSKDHG